MKNLIYRVLVRFANWFAVAFQLEVSIFDRFASWFETEPRPKPTDFHYQQWQEDYNRQWRKTYEYEENDSGLDDLPY